MCEFVEAKRRWVFRRKTCFQCGARPGAVGGRNYMPGRSIKNPSKVRDSDVDGSTRSLLGRQIHLSSHSSSSGFGRR